MRAESVVPVAPVELIEPLVEPVAPVVPVVPGWVLLMLPVAAVWPLAVEPLAPELVCATAAPPSNRAATAPAIPIFLSI